MHPRCSLPEDLQAIANAIGEASRRAEALVASNVDAMLRRPAGAGRWSAAQCLAHLALCNVKYVAAMRTAIQPSIHLRNQERTGPIQPGLPTRWLLAGIEPPVRRMFRAHGATLPPEGIGGREALREFLHSHHAVSEFLRECRQLDLNGIRFENPFLPAMRLTVGAGFLLIAAHDRRHLWQAGMATSNQ